MNIFSFTLDGFRVLQLVLTLFVFLVSTGLSVDFFKNKTNNTRYIVFTVLTLIGTLGVFASSSLFTMFFFFEIMSFASYGWVLEGEDEKNRQTSNFYLYVSLIAGMVMLMGLFLLYCEIGTLEFSEMLKACESSNKAVLYIATGLTLVGFGTKAGLYPLHFWLLETYVTAPAPATAMFSAILSKTGVFGAIMISVNLFCEDANFSKVIMVLAVITMLWGGICGICQTDMKKIVAYSSMSQIGFIFVGIAMMGLLGEHNTIASMGTVLHMLNHSFYKLILFGICSVIFVNIKSTKLEDIKGLGRKNPVFGVLFVIAASGLGGVPIVSGYISKTLLHESIVEKIAMEQSSFLSICEILFLVSGGLTVAYMLKIGFALFAKNNKAVALKCSWFNKVLLILTAAPCVLMGILPKQTAIKLASFTTEAMNVHAHELEVHFFNFTNLKGAAVSISIGILVYFFIIKKLLISKNGEYKEINANSFALENTVYRPLFQKVIPKILYVFSVLVDKYLIEYTFKFLVMLLEVYSWFTSNLTDWVVEILIILGFRPVRPKDITEKKTTSYQLGKMVDAVADVLNKEKKHNYAQSFSNYEEHSAIRRRMISASLSYGLLFAGIGLLAVLFYLLLA